MADVKVKLLGQITVPVEGKRGQSDILKAGAEVSLPSEQAERLIRLGRAEKASAKK
jgi:hypothetical protein